MIKVGGAYQHPEHGLIYVLRTVPEVRGTSEGWAEWAVVNDDGTLGKPLSGCAGDWEEVPVDTIFLVKRRTEPRKRPGHMFYCSFKPPREGFYVAIRAKSREKVRLIMCQEYEGMKYNIDTVQLNKNAKMAAYITMYDEESGVSLLAPHVRSFLPMEDISK